MPVTAWVVDRLRPRCISDFFAQSDFDDIPLFRHVISGSLAFTSPMRT
jgi:hypothetical protein